MCKATEVVQHTALTAADRITDAELARKQDDAGDGTLRICFVGSNTDKAGSSDWMSVVEKLHADGIDFQAYWVGEGPSREAMIRRATDAKILDRVHLVGEIADKARRHAMVKSAHVFLFCDRSLDGPTRMVEALAMGTPIVGYASPNASELVSANSGGAFAETGDIDGLVAHLTTLSEDRDALADLIGRAAKDGADFDEKVAFRRRSDLIKQYLDIKGAAPASAGAATSATDADDWDDAKAAS
jgi:glycosyltransferase involved in cell wall biosynthesis